MHKKGNPVAVSPASGAVADVAGSASKPNYSAPQPGNIDTIVGRKFGHWLVVAADATGKRVTCRCVCRRIRYLGRDMLERGLIDSCGCRPPTPLDREAYRIERERAAVRRKVVEL
jgi:hypothetical protein